MRAACVKGRRCGDARCGQCRLIAKDPKYDDGLSPTPAGIESDRSATCPHLGGPTGETVGCRSCAGLSQLPTYRCGLHGLTVLGNLAPARDDVRACRWCSDNPLNRPRPVAARPGSFLSVPEPPRSIITTRPTSSRVVVTAVVGDEAEQMHAASGPVQRAFAESIGADYLVLRWNPLPAWPMACKFGMWAALAPGLWDVLLWLDTDALTLPGCVNPITLTAPGRMGVYDERPFHIVQPQHDCEAAYDRFRARMGYQVARPAFYFNAGVLVVPRSHREMLVPPDRLWVEDKETGRHCAEQNLLNARLWTSGLPFQLLDRRANWQSWPDKGLKDAPYDAILHWSGGPDRHRRPEMMAEYAARRPWPAWEPPPELFPGGPHPYAIDPTHARMIREELLTGQCVRVLEVGCHHGYSTTAFLDAGRSGAAQEIHLCEPAPTAELRRVIDWYAAPGVTLHTEPSTSLLARDAAFDLAFLDGDHAAETVQDEARQLAAAGCRVIFAHDVSPEGAVKHGADPGPQCLPGLLSSLGYDVTVDDKPRAGERTERGLLKAVRRMLAPSPP